MASMNNRMEYSTMSDRRISSATSEQNGHRIMYHQYTGTWQNVAMYLHSLASQNATYSIASTLQCLSEQYNNVYFRINTNKNNQQNE